MVKAGATTLRMALQFGSSSTIIKLMFRAILSCNVSSARYHCSITALQKLETCCSKPLDFIELWDSLSSKVAGTNRPCLFRCRLQGVAFSFQYNLATNRWCQLLPMLLIPDENRPQADQRLVYSVSEGRIYNHAQLQVLGMSVLQDTECTK
ncbi:hypothetical protein DVH24_037616 [Malus domestica]|uniref:Uncharacterized protein n=1 Tax=Malus domestica TaxID=3750 RepID=A0A498J3D7_MALDO|nr:hypothetical protein DVH24_037616 [Malus domestica]